MNLDFSKETLSKTVLDILASNLKDETDKDASKTSLKESLALIQKGNKLPYGPANHLLIAYSDL